MQGDTESDDVDVSLHHVITGFVAWRRVCRTRLAADSISSPKLVRLETQPAGISDMAATSFYPRGTVKRITKAHANRPLSKNVDILASLNLRPDRDADLDQIFLDYMLFMQE